MIFLSELQTTMSTQKKTLILGCINLARILINQSSLGLRLITLSFLYSVLITNNYDLTLQPNLLVLFNFLSFVATNLSYISKKKKKIKVYISSPKSQIKILMCYMVLPFYFVISNQPSFSFKYKICYYCKRFSKIQLQYIQFLIKFNPVIFKHKKVHWLILSNRI